MSMTVSEALNQLTALHHHLKQARETLQADWLPDDPPVTIVMGEFAEAVCDHIEELSDSDKEVIFKTVEKVLVSGDDEAKNAVATGFLEALQGRASANTFDFSKVTNYLGEEARAYCRAWDKFTGVDTPNL
jgi:hypothetical protein